MGELVRQGDTVRIHYVGELHDGTVFESTKEVGTFEFEAGGPAVLPGISHAVVGMAEGEEKRVEFDPDEAYGPYQEDLRIRVPSDKIPEGVKVGDYMTEPGPQGRPWLVEEIEEARTTLNGNHPLAGQKIAFVVTLVGIGPSEEGKEEDSEPAEGDS